MYILINAETNTIVGCAVNPVDEKQCSKNGQKVYHIPDDEYSHSMIGSKLDDYQADDE